MLISYILLIAFLCLFVFFYYFHRQKNFLESINLELDENEQKQAKITIGTLFRRQCLILTSKRILIGQQLFFFLNRGIKVIEINPQEISQINLRKRINFLYLVSAIIISYFCAPIGLILILYSLLYPLLIIDLIPAKVRLINQIGIVRKSSIFKILEDLNKGENHLYNTLKRLIQTLEITPPFSLEILFPLAVFFGLAIIQRILESHVKFDDFLIFPIYLAIPIISGRIFGKIAGALVGILGFLTVLTIMFPFPAFGILSDYPEVPTCISDTILSGVFFEKGFLLAVSQYICISLLLATMGFIAGCLSGIFKDYLISLPAILWLGFVALFKPSNFYSYDLYLQILISMWWIVVIINFFADRYQKWINKCDFIKRSFQHPNV